MPETLASWPPKSTPPKKTLPVPCRERSFATVTPPASSRAVPTAAVTGDTEMSPEPAALSAPKCTTPLLMVIPPVQLALLSAASVSLPVPFLTKVLVSDEKAKALFRVRVSPTRTSMELIAALRRIVRDVAKVSVTPKPVADVAPLDVLVSELKASPRAASESKVRRPAEIVTVFPTPPNELAPLSTSSPEPSLVSV